MSGGGDWESSDSWSCAPNPIAWCTPDGERCVTDKTMQAALRDSGAMLSSLAAFTVPAYDHSFAVEVAHHIFKFGEAVFVVFDPTDDGSSIVGAYRTLREAQRALAFHMRCV